jgi:hypothetical protein
MRWPEAPGVEMRTRAPEVQAARSRRHELATQSRLAAAPYLRANGQAQSRLTAVGRPRSSAIAEGFLKTQPTGGRAEQASNTARGTPKGSADLRFVSTDGRRSLAGSPFCFGVARCRSPRVRRTPVSRAPSDFFPNGAPADMTRAQTAPRERWRLGEGQAWICDETQPWRNVRASFRAPRSAISRNPYSAALLHQHRGYGFRLSRSLSSGRALRADPLARPE